jgi:PUA-domain protein
MSKTYLNLSVDFRLMKIKRRYSVRKDVIHKIREDMIKIFGEDAVEILPEKSKVEILELGTDVGEVILVNGKQAFFETDTGYFPTVRGAQEIKTDTRFVTVDRGAVGFVIKGADIMRPGVVDFAHGIKKGDFVIIYEETHKKPIAIGKSLWNYEGFKEHEKGKCVKNILYVGDKIWNVIP